MAQRLEALLAGDRKQPGPDRGLLPEPRHGLIGAEEDVLCDLLPVMGGAEHVSTKPDDGVLVLADERL
jgi:hypothetical protein